MEENKDIQYFDKMVEGAEKLIRPWKWALFIAVIVTNAVWGTVHFYAIHKAYQEPTTYEQEQVQDFESTQQEQKNKGSAN